MKTLSYTLKNGELYVQLNIDKRPSNGWLSYIAAEKAEKRGSLSGSGFPYPNKDIAIYNSRNTGNAFVNETNNNFNIYLRYGVPAQYYENCRLMPPMIHVAYLYRDKWIHDSCIIFDLPSIFYRSLNMPYNIVSNACKTRDFYKYDHPIRSQEDILYASRYTENQHWLSSSNKYWQGKPRI